MDKYLHKYIYALKKYEGRIRGGSIMDKYLGNYVNELKKYEGGMRGGFILTDAELDEKFKDLNNLDILRCYFDIARSDIRNPNYKPIYRTDISWTDKCEFYENQVQIIEYIIKNKNNGSLDILENFNCASIAGAVDLQVQLGTEPEVDRIAREAEQAKRNKKKKQSNTDCKSLNNLPSIYENILKDKQSSVSGWIGVYVSGRQYYYPEYLENRVFQYSSTPIDFGPLNTPTNPYESYLKNRNYVP